MMTSPNPAACIVDQVEAHPIPEHYRPRRVKNRAILVGDAAGYVTKCSGEGIYFAAKSGRMAAEAVHTPYTLTPHPVDSQPNTHSKQTETNQNTHGR